MIYSAAEATSYNLFLAKQSGTGIVLGFNEPNEKNQADNTVEVHTLCNTPILVSNSNFSPTSVAAPTAKLSAVGCSRPNPNVVCR